MFTVKILISLLPIILINNARGLNFEYHNDTSLKLFLEDFTRINRSNLTTKLHSIGKTTEGRELLVVEITATNDSQLAVPKIKLIGNIHGNEAAGREILLHFAEFLVNNYGKDEQITWLLSRTSIYILPSMNPDGFEISNEGICAGEIGRFNAKKFDLNRNFPDYYTGISKSLEEQKETVAIKNWMINVPFMLSASLHGGALVANYPFDTVKELKWETFFRELKNTNAEEKDKLRKDYLASKKLPSVSPDDDVFKYLATAYARAHSTMHLGESCDKNNNFSGGITNGALWYPLRGGMQDYNYFKHGCMELTLEISCCKFPKARELQNLWEQNKKALLNFTMQAHKGVKGLITDSETNKKIANASLKIVGREMEFYSSRNGEFWRILLPGRYKLEVNATGYHSQKIPFEVFEDKSIYTNATFLYVILRNESLSEELTTTAKFEESSVISTSSFATVIDRLSKKDIRPNNKTEEELMAENDPKSLGVTASKTSSVALDLYICLFFLILLNVLF